MVMMSVSVVVMLVVVLMLVVLFEDVWLERHFWGSAASSLALMSLVVVAGGHCLAL